MIISQVRGCCGVMEMNGISNVDDPSTVIHIVCEHFREITGDDEFYAHDFVPAQLFFTQASRTKRRSGYGLNLAKYIEKEGLGTLAQSEPRKNPNTDNYIVMWMWTPDVKALKKWWAADNG